MSRKRAFTLIELLIVFFIISILAAMIYPVFARARSSARKATCLSNIVQLGTALQLYASDASGALPPHDNDWAPVEPYIKNLDVFRCSEDASLVNSPLQSGDQEQPSPIRSSYAYISGLTSDGLPGEVIAFDKWIWHLGGRNVLFLDTHGSWYSAQNLWTQASERMLALDPAFQALSPEQRKAAREGEPIPGEIPWR